MSEPDLDPEEVVLIGVLVEASRSVERKYRGGFTAFAIHDPDGPWIDHVGIPEQRQVDGVAYRSLRDMGLLRLVSQRDMAETFDLDKRAFEVYDDLAGRDVDAVEQQTLGRLRSGRLDDRLFGSALAKWEKAFALLSSSDGDTNLTAVGHHLREAQQEFALAAVKFVGRPVADLKPSHARANVTVALGEWSLVTNDDALASIDAVWVAADKLTQRLEHGALKEGVPLTWEDARGAVFATAFGMSEVARALRT